MQLVDRGTGVEPRHEAVVWNLATGAVRHRLPCPDAGVSAIVSPDGKLLALGGKGHPMQVWDLEGGEAVGPAVGSVTPAAFTSDGRLLVQSPDGIQFWDAVAGRAVTPPMEDQELGQPAASGGHFCLEGRYLWLSHEFHGARFWDALTGDPVSPTLDNTLLPRHDEAGRRLRQPLTADWEAVTRFEPLERYWFLTPDERSIDSLRALAQLLSGQSVNAVGGLVSAGPDERRRSWADLAGRHPETSWAGDGDAAHWHQERLDRCNVPNWKGLMLHLDRLIALEPGDWRHHFDRGAMYPAKGDWRRGEVDLRRAVELKPTKALPWQYLAVIALKEGRLDDYRSRCAELLERFGDSRNPDLLRQVIWPCVLRPDAVADPKRLGELADRVMVIGQFGYYGSHPARRSAAAAGYLRAGQLAEAADILSHCLQGPHLDAWEARLLLAIAEVKRGKFAEAKRWLDEAIKGLDDPKRTRDDWDVEEAYAVLRAEAEQAVRGKGP